MKKILIVEDTPDNLEMMRVLFTAEGYDVCSATDGAAAVSMAESYLPDLIVMDINSVSDKIEGDCPVHGS